jgi:WD40 repeat protein
MSRALHKFIGHNDTVTKVEWSTKNPYSFTSSSFDRRLVTWNMKKLGEISEQNN